MNTQSESETQQDFEALYLEYRAKYEALLRKNSDALSLIEEMLKEETPAMTDLHKLILAACLIILALIAAPDLAAWWNGEPLVTFGGIK